MDTNTFCSGENLQQLFEEMTEMIQLKHMFIKSVQNKKYVTVLGNCKINTQVQVMKDVSIERANENTFLGVILDHKICWKAQI